LYKLGKEHSERGKRFGEHIENKGILERILGLISLDKFCNEFGNLLIVSTDVDSDTSPVICILACFLQCLAEIIVTMLLFCESNCDNFLCRLCTRIRRIGKNKNKMSLNPEP
jgi:hypothetical protein